MKLQQATLIAAEIIQALRPDCVQIQEAGSIRRQAPHVKDVELVYISKTTLLLNLFNQPTTTYFHSDDALAALIIHGVLTKDTTVPRWGPKYKRVIHDDSGIVIELFRAEPNNWGYILALRTGPADFNKPLEGYHILIITDESPSPIRHPVHSQPCLRVQHLPPDQRQAGQGNIVLWDENFTQEGLQTGGTLWAKAIRSILWGSDHIVALIHTHNGTKISIIKQWRLDKQGEGQ